MSRVWLGYKVDPKDPTKAIVVETWFDKVGCGCGWRGEVKRGDPLPTCPWCR